MKITPSTLANIILTSILLISMFLVSATTSYYETADVGPEYDPWIDLDDDGDIDLYDAVKLLTRYGAKGDAFPAKAALEYDSGWIDITDKTGQYFNVTHNLNSTDIIVDITGKTTSDGGAHQRHLGGTACIAGWSRTYERTVYSLVETSDGGYAWTGSIGSHMEFDLDGRLVKVDSLGNIQWNKTYHRNAWDVVKSLVETSDGGYALAGYTGEMTWWAFWLVKVDSSGNMQWNQEYMKDQFNNVNSLVETSDGGYAIAGTSGNSEGENRFWLIKVDSSGNMQWNKTYGGINAFSACSVVQTSDGGYAIAGNGFANLIKTDSDGNMLWNVIYVPPGTAYSMVETFDGGYALAGIRDGDFWLVKTDSFGIMQWNKMYGGTNDDSACSVVQTDDGGYALAGTTWSFGAGESDFWLVKTDSAGNMQWNQTYGGTSYDTARSVVQTDDGGITVAGSTSSFGPAAFWLIKVKIELGLAWTASTVDTITLHRGATDAYWNYVRVRIWKIKETS